MNFLYRKKTIVAKTGSGQPSENAENTEKRSETAVSLQGREHHWEPFTGVGIYPSLPLPAVSSSAQPSAVR
jgi:hypothetical protein